MESAALALATMLAATSPLLAQNPIAPQDKAIAPPGGIFKGEGGEAVFKKLCAACHMPDGSGYQGLYPALAKNAHLAQPGYPILVIVNGQNAMPAVGAMLSDQQIADVVNYLRTNLGNRYKATTKPADVAAFRH